MADYTYNGQTIPGGTIGEVPYKNPIQTVTDAIANATWIAPSTAQTVNNAVNWSPEQTPAPAPKTTTTPTSTPTTTPKTNTTSSTPSTPSTGDTWSQISQFYQGWGQAPALQDFANAFGGDLGRLKTARGFNEPGTGYTSPEGQWFTSQDQFNKEIDNAYNPQYDYLNKVEAQLQPDYQSALGEAQAAFNTQQAGVNTEKASAIGSLDQTGIKGQQNYESALAQARQLYDQLVRGYQQRFGGASSAGGAATEIANVERMRQQGQNYRSLQDINKQVELGKQDVENQYKQSILQLEQNKLAATNQAKRDFDDKLNQINSQRATLGVNKAQAKLQALMDMRNQVLAIDAENRQFKNALEMQRQQNAMALDTYAKQLAMTGSGVASNTSSAFNNLTSPVQSALQTSMTTKSAMIDPYTGQVRPYTKEEIAALGPYGYKWAAAK